LLTNVGLEFKINQKTIIIQEYVKICRNTYKLKISNKYNIKVVSL